MFFNCRYLWLLSHCHTFSSICWITWILAATALRSYNMKQWAAVRIHSSWTKEPPQPCMYGMGNSGEAWGQEWIFTKYELSFITLILSGTQRYLSLITCIETCQGQEWGIASSPLTTLGVAVLGFTAGLPQFSGQSKTKYTVLLPINIIFYH